MTDTIFSSRRCCRLAIGSLDTRSSTSAGIKYMVGDGAQLGDLLVIKDISPASLGDAHPFLLAPLVNGALEVVSGRI